MPRDSSAAILFISVDPLYTLLSCFVSRSLNGVDGIRELSCPLVTSSISTQPWGRRVSSCVYFLASSLRHRHRPFICISQLKAQFLSRTLPTHLVWMCTYTVCFFKSLLLFFLFSSWPSEMFYLLSTDIFSTKSCIILVLGLWFRKRAEFWDGSHQEPECFWCVEDCPADHPFETWHEWDVNNWCNPFMWGFVCFNC